MPAGKTYVNKSSPDAWGEALPHGEIWFDPVHAELIGEDTSEEYQAKMMAMNISGDEPNIDPQMYRSPERYQAWNELVGDDEEEDPGEAPPEDEHPDGGEPEAPPVQMGPDSADAGPSAPPTFSSPGGPTGSIPGPPGVAASIPFATTPTARGALPSNTIAAFRANIKARNPAALRALVALQKKAHRNPKAAKAFKHVAAPWLPRSHKFMAIRGEPLVSHALSTLLTTVLSPVAWGVNGVGTVSHEIAKTLSKLAGKL